MAVTVGRMNPRDEKYRLGRRKRRMVPGLKFDEMDGWQVMDVCLNKDGSYKQCVKLKWSQKNRLCSYLHVKYPAWAKA
jgi:hypothetical protein